MALVDAELRQPASRLAVDTATAIAGRFGTATQAVLFYGSGLRDGGGAMLDFYVIVSDYRGAYGAGWGARWLATLNRLLPPNVHAFGNGQASAKYAVLSTADFRRLSSAATRNPAVWARFAQPSRLVWVRDDGARRAVVAAVANAAPALLGSAAAAIPGPVSAAQLWQAALALTFATELRAEPAGRGRTIVGADPERYTRFTPPALAAAGVSFTTQGDLLVLSRADPVNAARDWSRRRWQGKALSALRLVKAAATYDGGIDYLASKVERHSGHRVAVKDWHRRWPLIGGLALMPRLLRKGAVR